MPEKVMVCPVCDSRDIATDGSFAFEQKCGLNRWRCRNCEYSGIMTVMAPEEAGRLNVKKSKRSV